MNVELQNRFKEWDKDIRAGVTGDWKIEQAIKDKLLTVKWQAKDEAYKSCFKDKAAYYNFRGELKSNKTVLFFDFIAKKNKVKEYAYKQAFHCLQDNLNLKMK